MAKSQPVHRLKDGLLTASIWCNETNDGNPIYSVSFNRSYLKDDEWQTAFSYARSDILKIARLAEQAYDWIARNARRHTQAGAA